MRKGFKHSEETKKKISEANKGKKRSEELKRKISEARMGKKHSEEARKKMSRARIGVYSGENHPLFGKKHSEEAKRKMSKSTSGENHPQWKGGVSKLNIPLYDTYAPQLEKYEEVRKTEEGYLEVHCTYCGKWFMPKVDNIVNRIATINGNISAENRLYCSNSCKKQCPIFGKTAEQLMKDDAVRAGIIKPEELNREVQTELRWMVLERDNYKCVKCGSTKYLHCHHKKGIWQEQIESADIDMCDTLCKYCHIDEHKKPGMTNYDLRRKPCN